MAYTTAAALKVYLNIPAGETSDDALLTTLASRAQAAVDTFCGRTFEAAQDTTRKLDSQLCVSDERRTLYLERELCAVTSITNRDGVAVRPTDYVMLPRWETPFFAILLKRDSNVRWTWTVTPEDAIAVVGRWAYSVTPPPDVVHVTERLAAYLYQQRNSQGELDRTMVVGGNMTVLPQSLPRDVQMMLQPYRRAV